MSLPTLDTPTFFLTIPSMRKEVKYRPFLVKEEKILMIALQTGEENVIFNAINEIIENCLFNQIKAEDLTTYDVEYIFLQITIRSKGADVELSFQCENEIPNPKEPESMITCGNVNDIMYDLQNVELVDNEKMSPTIMLDEAKQIGITMRAPTLQSAQKLQKALIKNDIEVIYDSIQDYVEEIFQGDKTFDDYTREEFRSFIESLNEKQFKKIEDFFKRIPKIAGTVHLKCDACGYEEEVRLEGLSSFLV